MEKVNSTKQLIINMIASLLSCVITFGISMITTKLFVNKLGIEANSYVGIANNFVNVAAIIATTLNTLAGRFITIKIHQNDMEGANRYFNSVFYANIGIIGAMFIPCTLIVVYLDAIMNKISPALITDVKWLFALTFFNLMVTVISATFSTATFAVNRLDLSALRTIESQVLRAIVLAVLYTFLPTKISYIAFATLISNIYLFMTYIHYTKKLLPQIDVSRKHFSKPTILEILSSSVWNTVMRAGQVLTNYLDVYMTKIWIGADESGYMSIPTQIVTAVNTLFETISAVFMPSLTISFANNNKEELTSDLKSAMKLTGFFANIPLCFMIGFGATFYRVWLPKLSDNSTLLYTLTLLIMMGTLVGGAISPLFNVYTIVNKLKWNSIVTLVMGVMNALLVFIVLQIPVLKPYGIYFIAGLSSFLGIIKNLTFTPMYAAYCLGLPKKAFYPAIFRYMGVTVLMSVIFLGLDRIITTNTAVMVIVDVIICGLIGSVLNYAFLFEKKERAIFMDTVKRVLHR